MDSNGLGHTLVFIYCSNNMLDSPDLKIKPVSAQDKAGFLQVGVQCYGGGLWHTWFDRDLTVAGRCIVFNATNNKFEHRLVQLTKYVKFFIFYQYVGPFCAFLRWQFI